MFFKGFEKRANVFMKGLALVRQAGRGLISGLKSSGGTAVGDAIKLKGLKHIGEAAEVASKQRGLGKKIKTMAEGVGKAAPSLAAGGLYAAGAKKLYDKVTDGETQPGTYA